MSIVDDSSRESKINNDQVDLREQVYNGRETGPIQRVQLATDNITTLHGIVFDIDPDLYRDNAPLIVAGSDPKRFYEETLGPWLGRHAALAGAEVRDSGRGFHVIPWFDEPVIFQSEGERRRWAGIVQVVQAALPIDPDQPGITALTRPIGSVNGKTDHEVKLIKPGTPVPVAEVLRLYEQLARSPFRTVMGTLLGTDRVSPCPICQAEGTSLSALDQVGRCYGSCGTVKLEQLYDLFLAPRTAKGKGASDAES